MHRSKLWGIRNWGRLELGAQSGRKKPTGLLLTVVTIVSPLILNLVARNISLM